MGESTVILPVIRSSGAETCSAVRRPALKDLFGSERTTAAEIAKFLKAPFPAQVVLAIFTVGKQKCSSKALVRAGLSEEEAKASLVKQLSQPILKFGPPPRCRTSSRNRQPPLLSPRAS